MILTLCNTVKKKWILYSIIHAIITFSYAPYFFKPIREHVGMENIAYKYFETGISMEYDKLSRLLCWTYAHIIGIIFIFTFWYAVHRLYYVYMNRTVEIKYIRIFICAVCAGIILIVLSYPHTLLTPDSPYNYVYAKEWMPMYWHGFLTNVINCSCMLFFPHPYSLSIVPLLFGASAIFYYSYFIFIQNGGKKRYRYFGLWICFLLLVPETMQILLFSGRNYTYAIVFFVFLANFLLDYLKNERLTAKKFYFLSFILAILATWRTEGMILIFFFPILLKFTYKEYFCQKQYIEYIKMGGITLVLLVLFQLPNMYGNEKYQGKDYFIINTPGPLSAIMCQPNANLSYEGADEDISNIKKVVPLEYLYDYGGMATQFYNRDNKRISRQSAAAENGEKFVKSAYSIFGHNALIYGKYQLNVFWKSIGGTSQFYLELPESKKWMPKNEDIKSINEFVMNYYSIGQENMKEYDSLKKIKAYNKFIEKCFHKIIDINYKIGIKISPLIKIMTSFVLLMMIVRFIRKREYTFVMVGCVCLLMEVLIIVFAPDVRANYYYYTYFMQYWFVLLSIFLYFHRREDIHEK